MRVLVLHTKYRYAGGEDAVVDSEIALLRSYGVDVRDVQVTNETTGLTGLVQLGLDSSWSDSSYQLVKRLCAEWKPDLVHVHNFWMRLSPSVHLACQELGIPTVQTLHNFRLLCLRADFLRDGKVCTDCLGKQPWRGVLHRCYRESFLASSAVAHMISKHHRLSTWRRDVNAFIALSEHSRSKFIAGGMDPERIFVKPNFVDDRFDSSGQQPCQSQSILYVGRLAPEKGLDVLLQGWKAAAAPNGQLILIGDGPLRETLKLQARTLGFSSEQAQFLGALPLSRVLQQMSAARAIVIPSRCFENCPRSVLEAFCCGRPVIASRVGALDEFVGDWRTGLKFEAGNALDLGAALTTILSDPALANRLGEQARDEYRKRFTPAQNFSMLSQIYESVLISEPSVLTPTTAHSY